MKSVILNFTLFCLLMTSCAQKIQSQQSITDRAKYAILAIKNRDMEKVSALAHPVKGIRFSPYSFVDISNDIVITANPLVDIFGDEKKYTWGAYHGSGEPIELTFKEYFTQFIYDKDFANAKMISYNAIVVRGNTQNNISVVYPNSTFVEYHFPGLDPKYEGMDWKSLRLVFEEKDNVWYLIAIVHDQWTI